MLVINCLSPKLSLRSFFLKKFTMFIVTTLGRNYLHVNIKNNININDGNKPNRFEIPDLPEPPTNCCFSGCANCVWIKYAEDVSGLFDGAEDKIKIMILNKIDDPNMKAFLSMELKSIKFKK